MKLRLLPLHLSLVTIVCLAIAIVARAQPPAPGAPDAGVTPTPETTPDAGAPPAADAGASTEAPDAGVPDAAAAPEAPAEETAPNDAPDALDDELAIDVEDFVAPEEHDFALAGATVLSEEDVFRTGGSVAVVDAEELERLDYGDPTNVFQRVPGVTIRVEDGFGLRPNVGIRGTNPERSSSVTLMEDGILFGPAPYSAPAAYYFPLITRMVAVEVYKGPAAILFGPQTVGGAINLVPRDVPVAPGGAISLDYGRFGTRRTHLHYGASNAWGGFLFEMAEIGTRGFKDVDFSPTETGSQRSEFVVRGFLQTDPDARIYQRVSTRLGYSRERSNETYLGLTDADFRDDPNRRYLASEEDRMRWQRFTYDLRHHLEIGDHVRLTTSIYRHDFSRLWHRFDRLATGAPNITDVLADPTDPTNAIYLSILTGAESSDPTRPAQRIVYANNDRTFVSQGVQTALRVEGTTGSIEHILEVGARLHYDRIVRDHTSEAYRVENRELVRDATPELRTRHERARARALAAYATYALEVGRFRLTPGLRTEVIDTRLVQYGNPTAAPPTPTTQADGRQHVVLPGLGVNVEALEWLNVFAGFHRGFGPVAPGQPASVDPELSANFELGLRARDERRKIHAEVAGFLNDYSNLLLTCRAAGTCPDELVDSQFNAGSVLVGGLEASYQHDLELTDDYALPIRASYGYMRSRFQHAFTSADAQYGDVEVGDEVPYLPRHQATLLVGLQHERFSANITGTFVSKMREQAGRGSATEIGEYFTDRQAFLDLTGEVLLRPRVHLTMRVENLTNAGPIVAHRPYGARPYRPLLAQAGFRVDL